MILFTIIFSVLISSTVSFNLCDFKKCKPNEMACAEIVPKCKLELFEFKN